MPVLSWLVDFPREFDLILLRIASKECHFQEFHRYLAFKSGMPDNKVYDTAYIPMAYMETLHIVHIKFLKPVFFGAHFEFLQFRRQLMELDQVPKFMRSLYPVLPNQIIFSHFLMPQFSHFWPHNLH